MFYPFFWKRKTVCWFSLRSSFFTMIFFFLVFLERVFGMCNTSVCRLVVVAVLQWSERKTKTLTAVATAWNTPAVLSSYFLLLPLISCFSPHHHYYSEREREMSTSPSLCVCVCASALRFFFFLFPCAFVSILKSDLDCCSTANTATATTSPDRFQLLNGSVVMEATHIHLTSFFLSRTNPVNIRSAKKKKGKRFEEFHGGWSGQHSRIRKREED